ncbi:MAG: hypothetical protein M3362_06240, partial [Acidobacteriota bacterium]|nr:hypothetical protein [Acidobacteriota bacterium]
IAPAGGETLTDGADSPAVEARSSQLEATESPDRPSSSNSPNAIAGETSRAEASASQAPATAMQSVSTPGVASAESADKVGAQSTSAQEKTTGEVIEGKAQPSETSRAGSTGGRKVTVKQLDPGVVLNGRYEIVRRIGGGGMGA